MSFEYTCDMWKPASESWLHSSHTQKISKCVHVSSLISDWLLWTSAHSAQCFWSARREKFIRQRQNYQRRFQLHNYYAFQLHLMTCKVFIFVLKQSSRRCFLAHMKIGDVHRTLTWTKLSACCGWIVKFARRSEEVFRRFSDNFEVFVVYVFVIYLQ